MKSSSSGTLVGIKDKNGKVLRNKVVTTANTLFDVNGDLKVPIETIGFLMGTDVSNPDYTFKITKIECLDFEKNQCVLTLDQNVPHQISPMTVVSDQDKNVKNADYFYFVGYPSWAQYPSFLALLLL